MKLENIPVGVKLSLTINPSDNLQYFGKDGRMVSCHAKMIKVVNSMKYWCTCELYPEYSFNGVSHKMGSGPRIHYHGTVVITDLDYFLELGYTQLRDVSHFEIDTIADPEKWTSYCLKARKVMEPMYQRRKLPYKLDSSKVKTKQKRKADIYDYLSGDQEEDPLDKGVELI